MCAWMLEREVVDSFLPVKGKTPMCSEIRVHEWRLDKIQGSAALTRVFINDTRSY